MSKKSNIAIIGGGPAGLMAAEVLSAHGHSVTVYERKASVGRKFLMAGRGGLNLTHSEDIDTFIRRYGRAAPILDGVVRAFPPQALRAWCEGLGEKTFVGTSGRVFPENFKASPLLRAWILRLEKQGVAFKANHDWKGWNNDSLMFDTPEGSVHVTADATLLALGGASWPRLGTDGSWVDVLQKSDVAVEPLKPSNCGFYVSWSPVFSEKFAGQPLKSVAASFKGTDGPGEMTVTMQGIEGGAIYALSAMLRDEVEAKRHAQLTLDLKPDLSVSDVEDRLRKPRGRESLSNHLRKTLKLSPVTIGLLMEHPDRINLGSYPASKLAALIKAYPLKLDGPFSIERAISSAGGIAFSALDQNSMLVAKPGVFAAGEMLDWEAPTGGYLLQASIATGVYAAQGMLVWLAADSVSVI